MEKLHAKAEEQLNANATEANFAKVRERASEKKQLEREIAQLGILRAKLADLQKAYAEATSLTKNLEGWETNLALIAGLAVVLGVIVSQAARFVYFELIFRIPLGKAWRLIRGHRPTKGVRLREAVQERRAERRRAKSALLKQRSPSFAAAYQDLVTNHLRYAEGAVNMSIPVVLFAFVYPCFAAPLVDCHNDQACFLVDLRWTAISVAICLIGSGWFTYLRFREKEREWLSQNLDAVAISEAAAAATKAAGDAKRSADAAATSANSAEAAATEAKKHAANPAARANPPAA